MVAACQFSAVNGTIGVTAQEDTRRGSILLLPVGARRLTVPTRSLIHHWESAGQSVLYLFEASGEQAVAVTTSYCHLDR